MEDKVTYGEVWDWITIDGMSPFALGPGGRQLADGTDRVDAAHLNLLGGYVCSVLSTICADTILWDRHNTYRVTGNVKPLSREGGYIRIGQFKGVDFTPSDLDLTKDDVVASTTALFCGFEPRPLIGDRSPIDGVDWGSWLPAAYIAKIDQTTGTVTVGLDIPVENQGAAHWGYIWLAAVVMAS